MALVARRVWPHTCILYYQAVVLSTCTRREPASVVVLLKCTLMEPTAVLGTTLDLGLPAIQLGAQGITHSRLSCSYGRSV